MRNQRLLASVIFGLLIGAGACNSDPTAPMEDAPLGDPTTEPICDKDCPPPPCEGSECEPPPECYMPEDCEEGCTLTQGYWKNHDAWPVGALLIGTVGYSEADMRALLEDSTEGDVTLILVKQLIAAELSIAAGADPTDIETILLQAHLWLASYADLPADVSPSTTEGQVAVQLATWLAAFNEGYIGPGHCLSEPVINEPMIVL